MGAIEGGHEKVLSERNDDRIEREDDWIDVSIRLQISVSSFLPPFIEFLWGGELLLTVFE